MLFIVLLAVGLVSVINNKDMDQVVKVGWIIAMTFFAMVGMVVVGI